MTLLLFVIFLMIVSSTPSDRTSGSTTGYSPGSSTCMQEVSAQQDESSVGLFRGAGCVSSPSPLLWSLSPPFLPPSFLPSVRVSPISSSFSPPPP